MRVSVKLSAGNTRRHKYGIVCRYFLAQRNQPPSPLPGFLPAVLC